VISEPAVAATASADVGVVASLYEDGVMVVEFMPGLIVDGDVARMTRELQAAVADGPFVAVADLRGLAYADNEAREHFSTDPSGDQCAIALLVGPRVSSYVAARWVSDYELDRPVRVFTEPAAALEWARQTAREFIGSLPPG